MTFSSCVDFLEHHADAAFVRRDVVDRHAIKPYLAMGRSFKTGEHHKTRRLAGP